MCLSENIPTLAYQSIPVVVVTSNIADYNEPNSISFNVMIDLISNMVPKKINKKIVTYSGQNIYKNFRSPGNLVED